MGKKKIERPFENRKEKDCLKLGFGEIDKRWK